MNIFMMTFVDSAMINDESPLRKKWKKQDERYGGGLGKYYDEATSHGGLEYMVIRYTPIGEIQE